LKRDFLTNLGLDDEQVNKIMAEHGKTVNSMKDELDKVEDYKQEATNLKTQLKDRDSQLKDLEKKAKDNEELLQTIKDLQKENDDATKKYEDELQKTRTEAKLELALKDAKAKNPKAVKALLNTEAIKLDGDKLLGLEEQLKSLQESDSYLFGGDEPAGLKGRKPNDNNEPPVTGVTKEQFNKMSYKERVELFNTQPENYKQLSQL
jgi:DNA repair exonuclease SbcCD ATPase subunit